MTNDARAPHTVTLSPPNLLHYLLRVRHARAWPAFQTGIKAPFTFDGQPGAVTIFVEHYAGDDLEAVKGSTHAWRFEPISRVPGTLGPRITVPKGGSFDFKSLCTRAQPGETDIVCSGWSANPAEWLLDTLRTSAYATAANLSFELDDVLQIVGDDRVIKEGERAFSKTFPITVVRTIDDPLQSTEDAIQQVLARQRDNTWLDKKRGRLVTRAVTRLFAARLNSDPLDRFVDFWMVSEFIASQERTKNKAYAVKHVLARHMGMESRSKMALLYEALRLEQLKDVRDDIVHGEHVELGPGDLGQMEAIATELIRYEIGQSYSGNRILEGAIARHTGQPHPVTEASDSPSP